MPRTAAALMFSILLLLPVSASAANDPVSPGAAPDQPLPVRNPFQPVPPLEQPAVRPAALIPLYGSFAGLQAYDGYTTTIGVKRGASEANPLLGGLAGKPAAIWAIKGGVTVTSIYAAERLWRQHRRAEAIAVMVVSNGVMAAVAARNASVSRAQR